MAITSVPLAAMPPTFSASFEAGVSMLCSKRTMRGCRLGIRPASQFGAGPETVPTVKPGAPGPCEAGGAGVVAVRFFVGAQRRTRTKRPWRRMKWPWRLTRTQRYFLQRLRFFFFFLATTAWVSLTFEVG